MTTTFTSEKMKHLEYPWLHLLPQKPEWVLTFSRRWSAWFTSKHWNSYSIKLLPGGHFFLTTVCRDFFFSFLTVELVFSSFLPLCLPGLNPVCSTESGGQLHIACQFSTTALTWSLYPQTHSSSIRRGHSLHPLITKVGVRTLSIKEKQGGSILGPLKWGLLTAGQCRLTMLCRRLCSGTWRFVSFHFLGQTSPREKLVERYWPLTSPAL